MLYLVGLNLAFVPQIIQGVMGVPRGVFELPAGVATLEAVSAAGMWVMITGLVLMASNLFGSLHDGAAAPDEGLDRFYVTERLGPLLPYPFSGIRQTDEGSFMLGVSNEAVGYNTKVTTDIMQYIARRATDAFPCLGDVRIVRSWAALRPLTPDRYPIYHESTIYPGAFVLTSHSGVSLASLYATDIAHWIADGTTPEDFEYFSPRRFDV